MKEVQLSTLDHLPTSGELLQLSLGLEEPEIATDYAPPPPWQGKQEQGLRASSCLRKPWTPGPYQLWHHLKMASLPTLTQVPEVPPRWHKYCTHQDTSGSCLLWLQQSFQGSPYMECPGPQFMPTRVPDISQGAPCVVCPRARWTVCALLPAILPRCHLHGAPWDPLVCAYFISKVAPGLNLQVAQQDPLAYTYFSFSHPTRAAPGQNNLGSHGSHSATPTIPRGWPKHKVPRDS